MPFILPVALTVASAFLLRRLYRLLTSDCDLSTLTANLNPSIFRGKVVWITGASSGIGAGLAVQLARHGALLILTARSEETLSKLADNLPCPRTNVHVLPVDLAQDFAVLEKVAAEVPFIFGRLDFLFNNAGISTRVSAADLEMPHVARVLHLNYLAPVALARACLPALRAAPGGGATIVNTISIAAIVNTPLRSSYSASKAALVAYFRCLALEEPYINVVNVFPGSVRTSIAENAMIAGGAKFGKTDVNIVNGLSVERCVDRILAAVSSGLQTSWIAGMKELFATRLAMYCPSLWAVIARWKAADYRRQIEHGHTA